MQVSQDFSSILIELYVSHWERIKQNSPSLHPVLRFIGEAKSLYAEAGALVNSSMVILNPNIPMAQDLIQMLYTTQDEELRAKGIADR